MVIDDGWKSSILFNISEELAPERGIKGNHKGKGKFGRF